MYGLIVTGVIVTAASALGILVDEGPIGLRHPLNFRGRPPNLEWYKRAMAHAGLVGGCLAIATWTFLRLLSR